jgi:hypothetical protein
MIMCAHRTGKQVFHDIIRGLFQKEEGEMSATIHYQVAIMDRLKEKGCASSQPFNSSNSDCSTNTTSTAF